MTVAPVYKQGWTMDDVHWSLFDPSKVEPSLLATVKAAALVEYNAPDYVIYLKRDLRRRRPGDHRRHRAMGPRRGPARPRPGALGRDGRSQLQAGRGLCPLPQGLHPRPFQRQRRRLGARLAPGRDDRPLRGGIAAPPPITRPSGTRPTSRCCRRSPAASPPTSTVTTSCSTTLQHAQPSPIWASGRSSAIAVGRVRESDDDELAYSYYCANVSPEEEATIPYDRKKFSKLGQPGQHGGSTTANISTSWCRW